MAALGSTVDALNLFGDSHARPAHVIARAPGAHGRGADVDHQLAQPRVSTHLGKLRDAGVLCDRKVGASTFYRLSGDAMPQEARKLWSLLENEVEDGILDADRARCDALLQARAAASSWPDSVAGQMERHYSPGRTWEALARGFLGLMRLGDVLDAGSGDGRRGAARASRSDGHVPRPQRQDGRCRAIRLKATNVTFASGTSTRCRSRTSASIEYLLFNVLTHAHTPGRVVAEAARVLRPGGHVAIITLDAHTHQDVSSAYQHVVPGFRPSALQSMLERADLSVDHCQVTLRERREPFFEILTAFASQGAAIDSSERVREESEVAADKREILTEQIGSRRILSSTAPWAPWSSAIS